MSKMSKSTQLIKIEGSSILILLYTKVNSIIAFCQLEQSKKEIYYVTKMTLCEYFLCTIASGFFYVNSKVY